VKRGEEFSSPFWAEIEENKDGVFLHYLDYDLSYMTDSWFERLSDAKESAKIQFMIEENDWTEVPDS